MGVPHYFKYLVSNFSDCVCEKLLNNKTILYFDFNSIIYDAKNKITPIKNKYLYEYLIIQEVILLLDSKIKTISNLGCDIEMIYIAIDGIAPMAKIIQQRQRRYKSIKEMEIINELDIKYNKNLDKPKWDSNSITPGTKFMDKLNIHLLYYLNELNDIYPNIKTILDDSNNAGEGEHKLMKHISTISNEYTKVIYGLDADLIVLSLLKSSPNTYLIRESSYFPFRVNDNIKYLFLDINILKSQISSEFKIEKNSDFIDYIFLTFLLGNDFIPNLFILKITESGFDYLKRFYIETKTELNGSNLIINNSINYKFFKVFLGKLLLIEDSMLISLDSDYNDWKPFINPKLDEYERKRLLLNFYPYYVKTIDNIKLGTKDWQNRFYDYWLGNYDNKVLDNMIKNYYEGLEWILHYYVNNTCIDWLWYYKYPIAPSIKMLINNSVNVVFNMKSIDNNIYNIYQLLIILPAKSHKLIKKKYRHLTQMVEFQYLFPIDYKLLTLHKKYYHECYAVLPNISSNLYERVVYNLLEI